MRIDSIFKLIFFRKIFLSSFVFYFLFSAQNIFAETFQEYFAKGNQYSQNGDYTNAIKYYQKAIEIDSNQAPVYNALGLTYEQTRADLSQIVWYFKVATDIDPNFVEAYENLGRVYNQAGMSDAAEKYYLKALAIQPNLLSVQFALGWLYLKKSQPNEATHYFKEVLKRTKIPYAYYGLGVAYSQTQDYANVLEAVTNLRGLGEDDLAAQLESMIRKPEEELPSENPPTQTSPPAPTPQVQSSVSPGGVEGVTRVRLRGKLFTVPNEDNTSTAPPLKTSSPPRPTRVLEGQKGLHSFPKSQPQDPPYLY